jgi:hypothetical protein
MFLFLATFDTEFGLGPKQLWCKRWTKIEYKIVFQLLVRFADKTFDFLGGYDVILSHMLLA